jgi:hypothetical protein
MASITLFMKHKLRVLRQTIIGIAARLHLVASLLACAPSALGILFGPILYLWPWLIGVVVFYGFVGSDQGAAIAHDFAAREYSAGITVASLLLAWLLVALGCLLAVVSCTPTE